MTIRQTSKIQIRRGPEIDLPGAPTALSPLVFEPSLDEGELALAVDTGRLFVGQKPTIGQPNYDRTSFPYQNVEVLTENSTETFRFMTETVLQSPGPDSFISTSLADVSEWTDVTVTKGGVAAPMRFDGARLLVSIDYFIYTNDDVPVRQGTVRILHIGGGAAPEIVDNAVSVRRTDLTGEASVDPDLMFQNVEFRAERTGVPTDPHFVLQYRNFLPLPLKLLFRHTRPIES